MYKKKNFILFYFSFLFSNVIKGIKIGLRVSHCVNTIAVQWLPNGERVKPSDAITNDGNRLAGMMTPAATTFIDSRWNSIKQCILSEFWSSFIIIPSTPWTFIMAFFYRFISGNDVFPSEVFNVVNSVHLNVDLTIKT